MPRRVAGPEIERLIQLLAKLPGLGSRSARRAALTLVKRRDALLVPLVRAMAEVEEKVRVCHVCGNIDTASPCAVCTDPIRDDKVLVVVEDVADLWALERAGATTARYHVLGGVLSPLDGVGPDDLTIAQLLKRCLDGPVAEVILAVNATVEGQATAHYIMDQLATLDRPRGPPTVTRLAHGVPVGGELDYLDDGTIAQAMRARTKL